MNRTFLAVLLSVVLADFLALTSYVLWLYGPIGWIAPLAEGPLTVLLTFDLVIGLGIATTWMFTDARARGVNPWPYLALTATTGSAGPLLYVINRLRADAVVESVRSAAA